VRTESELICTKIRSFLTKKQRHGETTGGGVWMGGTASVWSINQFKEVRDVYEQEGIATLSAEDGFAKLQTIIFDDTTMTNKRQQMEPHDADGYILGVGDVVKVPDKKTGMMVEGVVSEICRLETHQVLVDLGDEEETVDVEKCILVLRSTDLEIDDIVECKPHGMELYFRGTISSRNIDGTYDVKMQSDDPDDYERNVPHDRIRKLMTNRTMSMMRWHTAVSAVKAVNAFKAMGKFHEQALAKLHSIQEKEKRRKIQESESKS